MKVVKVGSSAAGKTPFLPAKIAKYAVVAIPVALSLTGSARRGVHELQVLASFLIHRFRQHGIEPDRGLVRALDGRDHRSIPTADRSSTPAATLGCAGSAVSGSCGRSATTRWARSVSGRACSSRRSSGST